MIMGSLNTILETNARLLDALKPEYEKENEMPKIGKIFVDFREDLRCYIKFCSHHEFYRQSIGEAKVKNKAWFGASQPHQDDGHQGQVE